MKILLAGNPNVGKSTVFNTLTGDNQHTGNWIGKTVATAKGEFDYKDKHFYLYDLPGTYSLNSHSKEEEVTRNNIIYSDYDLIILVADACTLERNMNLLLQTLEVTSNVILCINLIDEAQKNGITINENKIKEILHIPVVKISARKKEGIGNLLEEIYRFKKVRINRIHNKYIDECLNTLSDENINNWISIKLLEHDKYFLDKYKNMESKIKILDKYLIDNSINIESSIQQEYNNEIKYIVNDSVKKKMNKREKRINSIDRILTSRLTGIPIMIFLLLLIFFITIVLANYPSSFLSFLFGKIGIIITTFLNFINIPSIIIEPLMNGIYKTLTWVVAVMLPPMAIFFPMFSLLEDFGYLPRIAFNMDKIFQRCNSNGKQSLTMMMGFGCNAVGITNTRIIDSKRERLIAILTNNFIPCNGRFPLIMTLISMFLIGFSSNLNQALILTLFIILSIIMTFVISKLLSSTILKGTTSSFTLELPPFRRPEIIKTIIRSFKDKTLKVLKRAIIVSIPTGLLIWILANFSINDITLLNYLNNFFSPLGNIMGLDGVILTAFILAFPANEIVLPIILMTYLSNGKMTDIASLVALKELLILNGWTFKTALLTIIFSIFHFPCSTTLLTIKAETKSKKWTIISFLLPTIIGIILCSFINFMLYLF